MPDAPAVQFDVKSFIKQTAEESGMSATDAVAFAEKCYDGIPYAVYQPFGGAESFEEIEAQRAADLYQGNVNSENYALQSIITNVMNNADLSAGEKSTRIQAAAATFEERINALDISKGPTEEGTKNLSGSWLEGLKRRLKGKRYEREDPSVTSETDPVVAGEKKEFSAADRKKLAASGAAMAGGKFPIESATDVKNAVKDWGRSGSSSAVKTHIIKRARALGAEGSLPDGWISGAKEIQSGIKMFVDSHGDLRWLSFSTNAFEDHSQEVFSTKSIEEAISYSEKMGDRGPLRVFHIEGADIGTCDFQAMEGRFLIESGTFDNTLLGQKAVQYFEEHPEVEWQISVGYYYKEHDDEDGTYEWMRIKERSILPVGKADNPYTGFWTHHKTGEKAMHSAAKSTLTDLFGPEITEEVISAAAEATKSLEDGGVRFKEMSEEEFGEIVVEATAEGSKEEDVFEVISHEHGDVKHKHRVKMQSEHNHTGLAEKYKAMTPADAKKAAAAEDAKDGGKDDADENADGSKKTAKKEADEGTVKLAGVLGALLDDVAGIKESLKEVGTIAESVKALQASDEERMGSFLNTRYNIPGFTVRPSESNSNLIDGTKEGVKHLVGDTKDDNPVNPASPYIMDLIGGRTSIQQG